MAVATTAVHGTRPAGHRFAESAGTRDGVMSLAEFGDWWARRAAAQAYAVDRIPFADLSGWHFERTTGNLAHASGRFFAVEGLHVETGTGRWNQPVINQPEIGTLGILAKEFDGVLHLLMQAKMEPGNVNMIQLSPTVQATRSNYTRVHHGKGTRYLEYFTCPAPGQVHVDVLQSEQGEWFYRKRNRNMLVEVTGDVAVADDFCWLTLGQIGELLSRDNLINMDARTVLSCIPYAAPAAGAGAGSFGASLAASLGRTDGRHTAQQLQSWWNDTKTQLDLRAQPIPLAQVDGWRRTADEIRPAGDGPFSIIAVSACAPEREVARWTQPMLAPHGKGIAAFLAKRIGGVVHVLVHANVEAGNIDVVELGPTVQCPGGAESLPPGQRPRFLAEVLGADPQAVRFAALLSEEGGRFYHAQTAYLVVEVGDDFAAEEPPHYAWMTLGQLSALCQESYRLNIQARSLLACLHSLW